MKPIYLLSTLFLFSLRAQAPVPVPLAHGDVPGEPHHHLKIENAYVRAYYVEVPPHGETQLHQHDRDYIFVTLGSSDVTNTVLGKPEAHLVLKDGEVHFTRGGFAHVARNNSGAPFRNVTIELLQPQSMARNLCAHIVEGEAGPCRPFKNGDVSLVPSFETGETLVQFVELQAKAAHSEARAGLDQLLVVLDQSEIRVDFHGQSPAKFGAGGILWLPAGSKQSFENSRNTPSRFLLIAIKESNPPH